MTPEATIRKRKNHRTLKQVVTSFIGSSLPMLVAVWLAWYGTSQNSLGTVKEQVKNFEVRLNYLEKRIDEQKAVNSRFREELGIVLNRVDTKVDSLLEGQRKQYRFNLKMTKGNKTLLENLEDIFGPRGYTSNNNNNNN